MILTELDVINTCLATMGEEPVNSLNSETPFLSAAKHNLRQANYELQAMDWWFNQEFLEIRPEVSGEYKLPADVVAIVSSRADRSGWYSIRRRKIYDNFAGQFLSGNRPVRARVKRLLAFDDLPIAARNAVQWATVVRFINNFDGDELKLREAKESYASSYGILNTEHIRAVQANVLFANNRVGRSNIQARMTTPYNGWVL